MTTVRSYGQEPVWAVNAETTIPASPLAGVAYRDEAVTPTVIQDGQDFDRKYISQNYNELYFRFGRALRDLDQGGIFGWSDKTDYVLGAIVRGSDTEQYRAVAVSGPATSVQDPVPVNPSFWLLEHQSGIPVGGYLAMSVNILPEGGFLLIDGSEASRTVFARLYAKIGTTFGIGNGSTTFNLPDPRGAFFRALDIGRGLDPGRSISNTLQEPQVQTHIHVQGQGSAIGQFGTQPGTSFSGAAHGGGPFPLPLTNDGSDFSGVVNPAGVIGLETRPVNFAVVYFIKY